MPSRISDPGQRLDELLARLTDREPDAREQGVADRRAENRAGFHLMSGRSLVEQTGAPPMKDIRILGIAGKAYSKEYDAALDALQNCHSQLGRFGDPTFEVFDSVKDSLVAELGRPTEASRRSASTR